uniref:Predicted protein n=1 Tax=Hordeum vulgare subsp. vulgare TaxID=112509 RepID=F2EGF9_HORVV|nr:predicted protein [Hordeum vulgare subsp. vulgare]
MALVNPNNNTWRSMAIAFLVLVMVSACTLPSCHAARKYVPAASGGDDRYCAYLQPGQACNEFNCNDMCSRLSRGRQHFMYCTRQRQCCCWFT